MFFSSPVLRWHICNYDFSFLQYLCFDWYSHYFHFVLTVLSRTIISTPPPPFLSLLQLLYPSSLKLTWISTLSFVSTMHITSGFFSFKYRQAPLNEGVMFLKNFISLTTVLISLSLK
ncbi:hypothetical protein E2C01_065348 [Portunus trituberculatus]|uniref:Uncharacterized protein n=1 Tax=Portunus trituberculatus TaxID=210409 RepID=A0A5B7HMS2_PORTR|nr:hypothetical protein [Portunus trituberculatus]